MLRATTTQFLYSGAQAIAEYDGSGTLLRRYVHGVGTDEPIAWYEGTGTSDRRFLMADHQGSIIGVTNSSGGIIDKNSYSIYGVPDSENIGRFQYTGQMWIAEADVYHYKARAYDPHLRRFLQADPIGYAAGMNIYAYVGGDPMNFVDPSGQYKERKIDEKAIGLSVIGDWNGNGVYDSVDPAASAIDIGRWTIGAALVEAGINPWTGEEIKTKKKGILGSGKITISCCSFGKSGAKLGIDLIHLEYQHKMEKDKSKTLQRALVMLGEDPEEVEQTYFFHYYGW